MMEGAIMEYVKWFIGIVSVIFLVTVVSMLFRLGEVNTFQQEVNYQIERNGGLTDDAKKALNEYAEVQHNGFVSFSLDEKVNLYSSGSTPFSGFSLIEIEDYNGGLREVVRGNEQAPYGTPIKYAMVRNIGAIGHFSLDPAVIGESASRVRGTGNEGRQNQ